MKSTTIATPRKGITHLQKMKDQDFLELIQNMKNRTDIEISLKVDGAGCRFGKDLNGRPFFEGSRTGPIFEPNSFSNYAISKGSSGNILKRAHHYDEIFDIVTKSDFVKALPNDVKVIAEFLYTPMAEVTDSGLKFVTIPYDPFKIGKTLTLIPFEVHKASSSEVHEFEKEILELLYLFSNIDVMFVDPKLSILNPINIDKIISENNLETSKKNLAEYILQYEGIFDKFKLGSVIEGLILSFKEDGLKVKVTSEEFRTSKTKA